MIQHIFSLLASEKRLKELGELLDYHSHFPDFDVPGEMNDIIDDVISRNKTGGVRPEDMAVEIVSPLSEL